MAKAHGYFHGKRNFFHKRDRAPTFTKQPQSTYQGLGNRCGSPCPPKVAGRNMKARRGRILLSVAVMQIAERTQKAEIYGHGPLQTKTEYLTPQYYAAGTQSFN